MTDSIVVGIEAVAQHFGRSERQVRRWLRDGAPRLSQNRFDVLQIREWLDRRQGSRRSREPYQDPKQLFLGEGPAGKEVQEERLKKAKADLAEMEVKQRRGELVARREIEQMFVARIMAVRQGLLTLSRGLPPQLIHCQDEREMEIIITAATRELLLNFSRPLPEALGGVAAPPEVPGGASS